MAIAEEDVVDVGVPALRIMGRIGGVEERLPRTAWSGNRRVAEPGVLPWSQTIRMFELPLPLMSRRRG